MTLAAGPAATAGLATFEYVVLAPSASVQAEAATSELTSYEYVVLAPTAAAQAEAATAGLVTYEYVVLAPTAAVGGAANAELVTYEYVVLAPTAAVQAEAATAELVTYEYVVLTPAKVVGPTVGQITDADTDGIINDHPSGSSQFYHDGSWWAVMRWASDTNWYLWKRTGTSSWTRQASTGAIHSRGADYPDAIVDSANNRLYVMGRNNTGNRITSVTYSGGTWTIDSLVDKVNIPGIGRAQQSALAFTSRWAASTLFAFSYDSTTVLVNWSTDNGQSWQGAAVEIANGTQIGSDTGSSLTKASGGVDASEFSWDDGGGSDNYVGVCFSEDAQAADAGGLLRLDEAAAPGTIGNWTFQRFPAISSGNLTPNLGMCRDGSSTDNRLYFCCRESGGVGFLWAVFKRENDASGTFSKVELTAHGDHEARAALAYDVTNDELYLVYGDNNPSASTFHYQKSPAPTLSFGGLVDLFDAGTCAFQNHSLPHAPVDHLSDLLCLQENATDDDVWENLLAIPAAATAGLASYEYVVLAPTAQIGQAASSELVLFEYVVLEPTAAVGGAATAGLASYEYVVLAPSAQAQAEAATAGLTSYEYVVLAPTAAAQAEAATAGLVLFEYVVLAPSAQAQAEAATAGLASYEYVVLEPSAAVQAEAATGGLALFEYVVLEPSATAGAGAAAQLVSYEYVVLEPTAALAAVSTTSERALYEYVVLAPTAQNAVTSATAELVRFDYLILTPTVLGQIKGGMGQRLVLPRRRQLVLPDRRQLTLPERN